MGQPNPLVSAAISRRFGRGPQVIGGRSSVRFAMLVIAGLSLPLPAVGAEAAAVSTPSAPMMLDGRTFRVEAFERGKKVFDDRLVFKNGTFISESCKKFGFSQSPYYVRREGDRIQFLAETTSPTHGTMVWKGTVSKDRIEGGFRWTKERWYWTVLRDFDVKGSEGP